MRLKQLQIAAALLVWCNPLGSFAATNSLPNFDKRLEQAKTNQPAVVNVAKENAAKVMRNRVRDVQIDNDEILGVPKFVTSTREFLTGTNGSGGSVSAATAAAFPANDPHRGVKTFLTEHQALFGFGPEALATAKVNRDYVSAPGNFRTTIWQQQVDDIPVFDGIFKAHLTKNGELINVGSQFVPDLQTALGKISNRSSLQTNPPVPVHRAIVLAAENLGEVLTTNLVTTQDAPQGNEKFQHFRGFPILNNTSARLTWLPLDSATVQLCWDINVESRARGELYRVVVDAQTGEVWVRQCLTENLSDLTMNVWTGESPSPLSPALGSVSSYQPPLVPRTLVTFSALDTNASPAGWINDGGNTTVGNNVDAHLDWNNDNIADAGSSPAGSPNRVFSYAIDLAQPPSNNWAVAVVSLFYWNNWAHDKFYAYGFTEAAGNFQANNFGRGGLGGDPVQADGQDSYMLAATNTTRNNANFSTPTDGSSPRMQMYIFNGPSPNRDDDVDATMLLHEYTHGVSSRLVGGGVGISALQPSGMGEGWSDFCALSLLSNPTNDPDASYGMFAYVGYQYGGLTGNYYFGLRRYPCSVNTNISPLTYKDIDTNQISAHAGVPISPVFGFNPAKANEVHNMGEVWCVTLWEARARFCHKYGNAAGNQMMLQLVIDGMKLSPANPLFLQARDAILQADRVDNGGANQDLLWASFAKRGMGYFASSPANSTTTGVGESFVTPSDTNAPVLAVISPANNSILMLFSNISGTAYDGGSGLQGNQIHFTLYNNGNFWSGTYWTNTLSTDPSIALTASVVNDAWTFTSVPTGGNQVQGTYFVSAFAKDNAGNTSVAQSGVTSTSFTIDTSPPNVAITFPPNGSTITNQLSGNWFQGTASDNPGNNLAVSLFIRRNSDNLYWTGSGWGNVTNGYISNTYNSGTQSWQSTGTLPVPGSSLGNGGYHFIAIARDAAGNQQQVDSVVTVDYHPVYVFNYGSQFTVTPNMNWDSPDNWDVGRVPYPDVRVVINGYSPVIPGALGVVQIYGLDMSGGTLTMSGMLIQKLNFSGGQINGGALTLTNLGTNVWSGGTFAGICTISAGAIFNLNGSGTKTLGAGAILNNRGTINWAGPGLIYNYGNNPADRATINNQAGGVFNLTTDGQVFTHDYNESFFYNLPGAQLLKSGGTNATAFNNFALFNTGEVRVDSGAILFDGYCTLDTGTTLTGAGLVRLLGASAIKAPVSGTANLRLEAGTLTASGSAAYGGSAGMDWTAGTLAGNLEIASGSSLRISGAARKDLAAGAVLNNHGLTTWAGPGVIYNYGNNPADRATFNNLNGGVFSMLTDGQVFAHDYNSSWFNNQAGAQFRKDAGAGTTLINNFILNNIGEISATTGTLEFNDVLNLGGGGTFTGPAQFLISSGLTTLSNLTTIAGSSVTMTAGTLLGDIPSSGTLGTTNGGSFNWAGGAMSGTVGIAPGAAFKISGGAQKTMNARSILNNSGNVTWSGSGSIYNYGGDPADHATINNLSAASFTVTSNAVFSYDYNPSTINIASNATFAKLDGGGVTTCSWLFNNAGVASCANGTLALSGGGNSSGGFSASGAALLRFTGGTHSLTNGTRFTGNGHVQIDGATLLLGGTLNMGLPAQSLALDLLTGTLAGNGTEAGNFVCTWSGGVIGGNLTNATGGSIVVTNTGLKTLGGGAVLNNQGTIVWFGPGQIYNYGGAVSDTATINNQSNGLFAVAADGQVFHNDYNPSTINNLPGARFVKSAGTNATSINHFLFDSSGEISADIGGLLFDYQLAFKPNARVTGVGTVRLAGSTTLSGTLNCTGNLRLEAGLLTGITNATYSGTGEFDWIGGAVGGVLTLAPASGLNFSGPATKTLGSGAILNNRGTINWAGPGVIYNYGGSPADRATINNQAGGVFNLTTDGQVFAHDYNESLFYNLPGAQLLKSGGTNATAFNNFTLFNSGEVRVDSGAILFDGYCTLDTGTTLAGTGAVRLLGTSAIKAPVSGTASLRLEAGTLTASGAAAYGGSAGMDWTAGTLAGNLEIAPGSSLRISGAARKDLASGAILNNRGTINWAGPGVIYNYGGNPADRATFNNLSGGIFNLTTDGPVFSYDYNPSFLNNAPGARLRKTGGTGSTSLNYTFANSGVIEVRSGTVTFDGNYASASTSSELDLVLGGLTPGTEFTRLATSGNLPLDGTLKVTLTNSFIPTNGQSFTIATHGSRTGQFAVTQFPPLPITSQWQLTYNPGSLVLQVVPVTAFQSASITNGNFQFAFVGQTGSSCLIEVSTNLFNWTPLFTNTPFNGTLNFADPQTAQFPMRFYRAKVIQ